MAREIAFANFGGGGVELRQAVTHACKAHSSDCMEAANTFNNFPRTLVILAPIFAL